MLSVLYIVFMSSRGHYEVMAWFTGLFTEENINDIALEVIKWAIIGILGFILFLFRRKVTELFTKGKNQLKTMKERRQYKRTIKQIERQEIPLPENFLLLKSPEKNPELKKIYQMIDEGLIEAPSSYKLQKLLNEHPELKDLKLDLSKLPDVTPKIEVKPPKFPPNFK